MDASKRKLMFSVTLDDCRVDTFRSGGKGGQNQNKVNSGVRVVHELSGAVGVGRDSRDQHHNKRAVFARMATTNEFHTWLRNEIALRTGQPTVEEMVEKWMKEVVVDVMSEGGWVRE